MTPEQIKAKVKEVYPEQKHSMGTIRAIIECEREAFTAGASWAAGEMEKEHPEPKEDWTELVEKMFLRYPKISRSGMRAALTEGMQEAYERGREEFNEAANRYYVEKMNWEQQLAEQAEQMNIFKTGYANEVDAVVKLQSELTAAKAEIDRLKNNVDK